MKNINFLIILFFLFNISFGKNNEPIKSPKGLTETEAYKMLYDNQVKANDSILNTIYYALGGLGSAVLLVFASNWWFNDKKVMDIIADIDTKIKEVKKETILELTEKIREEIKEDNKDLLNNYQKQLETFNENYRQQIATLNETIASQNTNINEIINSKELLLKELILSEQKIRDAETKAVFKKLHRVEYYMWEARGVSSNAFNALIHELSFKLQTKTDIRDIRLNLKQMSETLDKTPTIYTRQKAKLITLFENLPTDKKLIDLKNSIIEKIESVKIKED